MRTTVYRKELSEKIVFFTVDYVKIIELRIVQTWRHMQTESMK